MQGAWLCGLAQNHPFPCQRIAAKIYEQSQLKLRSRKVIHHLLYVRINQLFRRLAFKKDFVPDHKIGLVTMCQHYAFVGHCKRLFPDKRNFGIL